MAIPKIKNPRTLLVTQFMVFIVTMFLIDLVITDNSVATAAILSVCAAIVFVVLSRLTQRSRM